MPFYVMNSHRGSLRCGGLPCGKRVAGECTSVNCDIPQGPCWEYIMGCSSSSQMIPSFRCVFHAEETMVAKRQSESVRVKSQQRYRRKRSLFKKAKEHFLECESDVFVASEFEKMGEGPFESSIVMLFLIPKSGNRLTNYYHLGKKLLCTSAIH